MGGGRLNDLFLSACWARLCRNNQDIVTIADRDQRAG